MRLQLDQYPSCYREWLLHGRLRHLHDARALLHRAHLGSSSVRWS